MAPDFEPLLKDFDLDAFDRQESTIYGVRRDLTLGYVNATWIRFARQNSGPDYLSDDDQILGISVLEAFAGPIRALYESIFERVLEFNDSYEQEYDCSSPREFRNYHMTIHPLPADAQRPEGLLVINSPSHSVSSEVAEAPVEAPEPEDYVQNSGQVVACSNCRRFQNAENPERWDWIPDYLEEPPAPVSHGICQVCLDYFYPVSIGKDR